MQVLKSWLKDYVDIKLTDSELSDKLSLTGTLVESIIRKFDDNLVVGHIREVLPHPNADKLQIAKVYNGIEELQIVCGAPNIAVGQKVPLALIGTKLQDFEIKKAEIRGIESFGMMCSDRELNLSEAHEGIKILPDDYIVGKSLNEYLSDDSVFEIEITPNRGDSLSHLGVAREIAVTTGEKLKEPEEINSVENKGDFEVNIEALDLCKQYSAIVIKGVKVGASPDWLQKRLIRLGLKPINNVVDVTNYILLDWGQPLHAFDVNKIIGKKIIVRQAGEFEKTKTLDGQERDLLNESLVIADSEKVIAIAGVMGAQNSEVDFETVDIVIESAEFDAASVRKTSKIMGLSTEASYRFERGIDSGRVFASAKYAAKMITEIAGGQIQDVIYQGVKPLKATIKIEYEKINSLLGFELSISAIDEILNKLGFEVHEGVATTPFWRHDMSIWQDLAEEVGRVYGYEKIKPTEVNKTEIIEESDYYKKEFIKNILVELGFTETVNYVFLSSHDSQMAGLKTSELLEVKNPMQMENRYLRNSLIPGLLKNIAKNPSFNPTLFFEFGHVFDKNSEKAMIGLAASGKNAQAEIENAVAKLKQIASIKNDINIIELSRDQLLRYKIKKPVSFVLEFEIDQILNNLDLAKKIVATEGLETKVYYKQVSKYPPIVRDLSFIVDDKAQDKQIQDLIYSVSEKVLLVDLFDDFVSATFGQNKKNLGYHIYLQDLNRALVDSEAEEIITQIITLIENEFNAKLRG